MSERVSPLAIALWAREFAALINAGVSLARCLDTLCQTSEEPLASTTREIREEVLAGGTLSAAMGTRPHAFSALGIALCRAGEVGGVLDETLAVWADWLERDLEFRARLDANYLLAQIGRRPVPREEYEARLHAAIPDLDARERETTWCRITGMMVSSGVPVLQALDVATREVYPEEADLWIGVFHEEVRAGRSLAEALRRFGFSPITVLLVAVGEGCGALDRMLDKAATLHERELSTRVSGALAAMVAPR
jgi:type II secretory pathway component PulF